MYQAKEMLQNRQQLRGEVQIMHEQYILTQIKSDAGD